MLSVNPSVCDHVLLVCELNILQTTRMNVSKFTTYVQLGQR